MTKWVTSSPLDIFDPLKEGTGVCVPSPPGLCTTQWRQVCESKAWSESRTPPPAVSQNASSPSPGPLWSSSHTLSHSAAKKPTPVHVGMARKGHEMIEKERERHWPFCPSPFSGCLNQNHLIKPFPDSLPTEAWERLECLLLCFFGLLLKYT